MRKTTKNLILVFVIGCAVFVLGNVLWGDRFQYESTQDFIIEFTFYQLYAFVLGYSNMYFFDYLNGRKWKEGETPIRIIIGIFGSVILTLLGLFVLRLLTDVFLNGQTVENFLANESWKAYSFGLWITLTIVVSFHVFYFYNKYQQKKVKESQLVAKTETAKFESLKNQLDPHFLFNSLNVLTSLIDENPRQAEKFTTKLSKVYRYVLEQKDKDLIPVEEELKFAKSYMDLLKMRFEDGITFKIPDTVSDPDLKIVPLSLQLLLENAVKHNTIKSTKPLSIEIFEKDGSLIIKNNVNPKASIEKGTKVGLRNINQRYSLVSKAKVEITNNNKEFKVKLPLLTQKIKKMKTDYINDNSKYLRAKKRVEDLKGFYGSIVAYCIVIPFLIYINLSTSPGFHWFWFPMGGWGLGIVIQAFQIFGYGASWEQRKIREIMNKENL
ncbi:histidine kinase [Urechidicola vernalis]|uniref:Histidine kinase n=1 Tax=Urechidicola vernalis TaxID=3075600 RepID=A0ABU2Y1W8_9FLAO|nr:histidine kinase [Urechidicola sp. P050]MDT0552199.1 histidine kinase [Urechidicola sp. P050]